LSPPVWYEGNLPTLLAMKKGSDVLTSQIIHPEILSALGSAGHGAQVVIADGNFAVSVRSPAQARVVYLNLRPGLVTVTDVLDSILHIIPVEAAFGMEHPPELKAEILLNFQTMLPDSIELQQLSKAAFYDQVKAPETALVIATGDTRRFANIILRIGVVV